MLRLFVLKSLYCINFPFPFSNLYVKKDFSGLVFHLKQLFLLKKYCFSPFKEGQAVRGLISIRSCPSSPTF